MAYLWIAPTVVAGIGLGVLAGAAARTARELRRLRAEVSRFSELRPALVELRRVTADTASTFTRLRTR
jgi:hypothetical protein